ncbi:MAG: hypothetical protein JKY94_10375 [Rhodobacteraceae bacterium]|nr:hypothetical protein [Paracoccaceae bacterium]
MSGQEHSGKAGAPNTGEPAKIDGALASNVPVRRNEDNAAGSVENSKETVNAPEKTSETPAEETGSDPVILTGSPANSGSENGNDGAGDPTPEEGAADPGAGNGEDDKNAVGDPPKAEETGGEDVAYNDGDYIPGPGELSLGGGEAVFSADSPLNNNPIAIGAYRAGVIAAVAMMESTVSDVESCWLSLGEVPPTEEQIVEIGAIVARKPDYTGETLFIHASIKGYHKGPQQGFKLQPVQIRAAFETFVQTMGLLHKLEREEDERILAAAKARNQEQVKVPITETMLELND